MEYLALVRRAQKHEGETKKIIKAWKKQVKNHLLTNVDALFNHVSWHLQYSQWCVGAWMKTNYKSKIERIEKWISF